MTESQPSGPTSGERAAMTGSQARDLGSAGRGAAMVASKARVSASGGQQAPMTKGETREPGGGERRHGADVDIYRVGELLRETGRLRLAVTILWRDLPREMFTPAIDDALCRIEGWVRATEMETLRLHGATDQHVIVMPINPMRLPGSEDMAKVAVAIRILDDLGLIARPDYA